MKGEPASLTAATLPDEAGPGAGEPAEGEGAPEPTVAPAASPLLIAGDPETLETLLDAPELPPLSAPPAAPLLAEQAARTSQPQTARPARALTMREPTSEYV